MKPFSTLKAYTQKIIFQLKFYYFELYRSVESLKRNCISFLFLVQVDIPEPGCAILRGTNKYICAGDTAGKV